MSNAENSADMVARAKPRPLSPHLFIYKPIPTMMASIAHRITGAALYFGTALVAWWLLAAATGPGAFRTASAVLGSPLGLLVLFAYTLMLTVHALGGLRHFIWDTGAMMDKFTSRKMAFATGIGGLVLTILIWLGALIAL